MKCFLQYDFSYFQLLILLVFIKLIPKNMPNTPGFGKMIMQANLMTR